MKDDIKQHKLEELSEAGREELALAIYLWKEFKSQGSLDVDIMRKALEFCKMLGVEKQWDKVSKQILVPIEIKFME